MLRKLGAVLQTPARGVGLATCGPANRKDAQGRRDRERPHDRPMRTTNRCSAPRRASAEKKYSSAPRWLAA